MLRHIWFAEVITRTLCVPASAFNLPYNETAHRKFPAGGLCL